MARRGGRTIDLIRGDPDTVILAGGGFYSMNLLNIEAVASTTTGPTTLNLQSATTIISVTLGKSFTDVLSLADGMNIVSVGECRDRQRGKRHRHRHDRHGCDAGTTVNNVENVFGSSGMDNVILTASPFLDNANFDLGGGTVCCC